MTPEQRIKFPPLAPDFVIELRSATDRLPPLQEKMEEYRSNGVKIGLLIDPKSKQVEIYQPGKETEILLSPASVDCGEVMPGFILNLSEIW